MCEASIEKSMRRGAASVGPRKSGGAGKRMEKWSGRQRRAKVAQSHKGKN
jgi:hypothetical protein